MTLAWVLSGINTALAFGSGSPVPGVTQIYKLGFKAIAGSDIIMQATNTAPSATGTGAGWLWWQSQPFLGKPLGWQVLNSGAVTAIYGVIAPCTVAQLPANGAHGPDQGTRGTITDASVPYSSAIVGTAPTGGGANSAPVVFLGTSWFYGG